MSELAIAATQYGDLKGTVSFDGFSGPFLRELTCFAKLPPGYTPVGVSIFSGQPKAEERWRIDLLAIDADLGGVTADELQKYASAEGNVKVFKFSADLSADEFLGLVKRVHVVAFVKSLVRYSGTHHS